jgi:hypothetical protein
MRKKYFFVLISILVLSAFTARAQYMKNAIGVRDGLSQGITYQHFYQEDRDLKLLLSFRDNGIQLTALLQRYEPTMLRFGESFYFYYGFGMHAGLTRSHHILWPYVTPDIDRNLPIRTRPVIGADGIAGIEFRIYTVPLAIGLEYKPFFDLFGHRMFRLALGDIGFTIKYHF